MIGESSGECVTITLHSRDKKILLLRKYRPIYTGLCIGKEVQVWPVRNRLLVRHKVTMDDSDQPRDLFSLHNRFLKN